MALLLSWLTLGVCTLLAVGCVALYLDMRGARRVVRSLEDAIADQGTELAGMQRELAEVRVARSRFKVAVIRDGNMTRDERVFSRFYDLAAARSASHCDRCPPGALCCCPCSRCAARRALFAKAEREIVD